MLVGALEENILTMLCFSEAHAAALSLMVAPDLFSTRTYRRVATKAIDYLTSYHKPPGVHLRDLLEDDLRRGDDGKLLGHVLDAMDTLAPQLQATYVLDELGKFIETRKLMTALETATDAAASGDLEKAREALFQSDLGSQKASPGLFLHDTTNVLKFLEENNELEYFPSGIKALDERRIRPFRKQLFLIIGAKKIGKSLWLIEVGKQAIMNKKSVLHISLENSEELTAKRYTQACFGYTVGKAENLRVPVFKRDQLGRFSGLDWNTLTPEVLNLANKGAAIKKLNQLKNKPRLLIKEFPTGTLTIGQLNAYLDALERQEKFKPDLILLDSVNKMSIRSDQIRTDLGRIAIQLRGIAVARNIAIVTPTHSNRAGDMAKWVSGAAHVGEDYSLLGTADTVCTISRTPAEKQHGLARILVDAARDAEDKFNVMITQNYATCQFCLDSVYMSKHLEEEVSKLSGEDKTDD